MSMSDIEEFEQIEAISSGYRFAAAGSIKKGDHCMLRGFPCTVIGYVTAKPGKHGSAKVAMIGVDIFTNKKH